MSTIEITNLLCHQQATFDFEPGCTIVTGPNSAGKTSLAVIIAALAAHDANPLHLAATRMKAYVTDGRLDGAAVLDDGTRWSPPDEMAVPVGVAPQAVPHAVGLVDFVRAQPPKQRAAIWEPLSMPADARSILAPSWTLPPRQLEAVLSEIERSGWDAASKMYEDQRAEAKRRWAAATGAQRWGSKVAASWVPDGWTPDLEGASVEQLAADTTAARERLRALNAVVAVSEHQIVEAVRARDEELPAINAEIDLLIAECKSKKLEYDTAHKIAEVVRDQLASARNSIRNIEHDPEDPMFCPACGVGLVMDGDNGLRKHVAPTPEEVAEHKQAVADADAFITEKGKEFARLTEAALTINRELREITARLNQAKGRRTGIVAKTKLADSTPSAKADEAETAKAETAVRTAEGRERAYKTWRAAREHHEAIVELEAVCGLLGPSGVRAAAMGDYMDRIGQVLENTEKYTAWMPIRITADYQITSGGRPIQLAAENERVKAQWLCQIATAYMSGGTKWVVLDCGDRLRGDHWAGLVRLCNAVAKGRDRLRIVLCATEAETPEGWQEIRL